MGDTLSGPGRPLKVLHVLRAPLGGLFRHVVDLAREQIRRGHEVGLIADSTTGGENADRVLSDLAPSLALGLSRLPMRRNPAVSDVRVLAHVLSRASRTSPDIIHGHGSKGGFYVRLASLLPAASNAVRAYTPHGGSLHYQPGSLAGGAYLRAERLMAARTDLLLFESAFIAARFRDVVGEPKGLSRVVHNGIAEMEFVPVRTAPDAAEFLYVGELRAIKGIDVFLNALAAVGSRLGTLPRAVLVGSGPDRDALLDHAGRLGLERQVEFTGPLPARTAFERGQILVVPSRTESLPYIVLEAAAARIPMIATNVGGIPEIFGPYRSRLLPPGDVDRLATRMAEVLSSTAEQRAAEASDLAGFVHHGFSIDTMVDAILAAYGDALARKADGVVALPPGIATSS